jgi:hypothetical protein
MSESLPQFEFVDVPKTRPGRRWLAFAIVFIVIVVPLGVIAVIADNVARSAAQGIIETKVRSALSIPDATPVDVTVGGTSVLLQLVLGKFERVDIGVDGLSVGSLSGDAVLTARGIPTDQAKPIDSADLAFSATGDQLTKLMSGYTAIPLTGVTVASGAVQFSMSFTVLGAAVPVSVALAPSAVDGQLTLTPKSVGVNGQTFTPDQLGAALGPLGGGIAGTLGATQKLCVASLLPKGFVLQSVKVSGASLQLGVRAANVSLNQATFATKGTCPAT